MPNLLRSLQRAQPGPRLYSAWQSYAPGGIQFGISETHPYKSATERLASYMSWIYVATSTIAADIAALKVGIVDADGNPVTSHPLLDRVKQPNPWFRGNVFRQTQELHLDLAGEYFVFVDRGQSGRLPPQALHILMPDRTFIVPDPYNYIKGYIYYAVDGTALSFLPDEVLHVRYANPIDMYRGASPVQALGFSPRINEGLRAFISNYLRNDARPGGLLTTEQHLDPKAREALERLWEEQHASFTNTGRIAVLSNGLKYQQTSAGLGDIRIKEISEWGQEDVLAAYNMPAVVLGLTTDYNHSDATVAQDTYAEKCLDVRRELWLQDFYQPLLAMYPNSEGLTVTVESPIRTQREKDFEEATTQLRAGAINVKQYLELIESPFADDAPEVWLVPQNTTVMTAMVDTPPAGGQLPPGRELQTAIRSAAAAEYAARKGGAGASSADLWTQVLGNPAAGLALARKLDETVREHGLHATYERLKGPGAKLIARRLPDAG